MSKHVEGSYRTFTTSSDLSNKQFYIVKGTGTDGKGVVLASAASDKILGVIYNKPLANENVNVYLRNANGTGKVIAGGTIAAGDWLTTDASGKAIATTTAGNETLGIAIKSGVANDIIEFLPSTARY